MYCKPGVIKPVARPTPAPIGKPTATPVPYLPLLEAIATPAPVPTAEPPTVYAATLPNVAAFEGFKSLTVLAVKSICSPFGRINWLISIETFAFWLNAF